jgi:pyrroloquinoline quinone (PQQ) biosynthesis protein C
MARLLEGKVTPDHYAAYLRETYFYTRENPQIQAVATAWFREGDRQMVKPFLRHALSEVGHDALALGDLENLGWKSESIQNEKPLPSTAALISFPYYAIQYRSPLSYLGYLYFLEFLPTARGAEIAAALAKVGVPQTAMTFLTEHRTVDVHHNRLMEHYAEHMLRSSSDIEEVAYCMTVTGDLYARMVEGAFQSADDGGMDLSALRVA